MEAQILDAPVQRVLLLEDRAFVTRRLQTKLEAGHHRLKVDQVSPILSDKTLVARLTGGQATVTDLRPIRRRLGESESESPEAREARERLKTQERKLAELLSRQSALAGNVRATEQLFGRWLLETAEDINWGTAKPKGWTKELKSLSQRQEALAEELVTLKLEYQREQEVCDGLRSQLHSLTTVSDEMRAHLEIDLEIPQDGNIELDLEYCVPGACWRPRHSAQWTGDSLNFQAEACVWQNTGEDWREVELAFSTQRATLGTDPPTLNRDLLSLQKKEKTVVLEAREESVKILERALDKMPGINDGGEVLRLDGLAPTTVLSDGRPHRVPLFEFQTPLKAEQVVTAELAESAFLKTRQGNKSSYPLLAGPVDLIKACGLVGRSSIEFVAVGEEFELSWGPQPALSVHREHKKEKEDSSLLSGWRTRKNSVEVFLTNLSSKPQTLEIVERIPVSELKSVKIQQNLKETTDKTAHDEHGFVRWTVTLPAQARRTLKLAYTVSKKKHVEGEV